MTAAYAALQIVAGMTVGVVFALAAIAIYHGVVLW